MQHTHRRGLMGGLAGLAAAALTGAAGVRANPAAPFVIDGAGRAVPIPPRVTRVFPAGPPAAILTYVLAPDLLIGWPRANRPEELPFLLPGIGNRPEVGRLTGRGSSANLETVLALEPQLIVDVGSTRRTFIELADRVQAQTGIPYVLLDGRLDVAAGSLATLGDLLGRRERAQMLASYADDTLKTVLSRIDAIPAARRPRVYYARGPAGLETGLRGSINVEILDIMGVQNVAGVEPGGLATVSLEQVLRWDPDVILTIDQDFSARVWADPRWAGVKAVREKRVHLSPKLPFGWVDFPPGVNRLIGLWWVGKMVFPEAFPEDLVTLTRDFYTRFYHVTPDDAAIAAVLDGRV